MVIDHECYDYMRTVWKGPSFLSSEAGLLLWFDSYISCLLVINQT